MTSRTPTPTLDHIRQVNKDSNGKNPVAVFVGGTSGIGEYTAYEFVRHTKSPTCYIVGRNSNSGEQVVSKLKEINAETKAKFIKSDVTLIKECDKLCDNIKTNEEKVNLLFLTAGFLTTDGRTENSEGLDTKMSVNYYGRWRIVQQLMPLVQVAADEKKEPARVVSVLSPGNEGPVYEDDLELKHKFSLSQANRHFVEFNSLAVTRFAGLYPNVSFIHAHPGMVQTGITRQFHWAIRYPLAVVSKLIAGPPAVSGEKFYYMGWSSPDYANGSHILGASLDDIKAKPESKGYLSKELQEKVWKHTEDKFSEIVQ